MKLNARLQTAQSPYSLTPLVLIHGLFGSLDNLGMLARDLSHTRTVLQIDLRNHGESLHSDEMNYALMAKDVLETLDAYHLQSVIPIGHSMGGKVAMKLSSLAPQRVPRMGIIDIAPVVYSTRHHDTIFKSIQSVNDARVTTRQAAAEIMRHDIKEEGVIQFLLKSFIDGRWRFNVPALWHHYNEIIGWETLTPQRIPTLFIRGANSPYIQESYREAILSQFPVAQAHVIAGAGHWVHAEKPEAVLRVLHRFLDSD
ncbi:esterase [Erwinia sp. HR93]|uniref:esterase n=1 Tax=Erwinia sp. HR93 TaxID=3094840 RepID=UPI002ADEE064|nr:esterase [Erwinia sp. HR93]MEA1064435.1 esterase [Erwinia sp. HR93]